MRLVVTLLALALSACTGDTATSPGGPVDRRFVLAPGEVAIVPEAGINLRFDRVAGDSRCPGDAVCVQAGDAIVRIIVQSPGEAAATYELHTGDMTPARHRDLSIALETLTPYPFSSRLIAPGDYRAALRITR